MPRKVVIDTDPGVDDALALLLAVHSPELEVAAVTGVAGNVPVETATMNIGTVLSMASPDHFPVVAKGASGPLRREPVFASFLHGEDGLGGAARPDPGAGMGASPTSRLRISERRGPEEILHQIASAGEPVTVIALGPLTNIALALERDAEVLSRLERLVIMGGAVEAPGNITAAGEFNFYFDPEAADMVFRSGLPLTVVPLDATRKALLHESALREAVAIHPSAAGRFVLDCTAAVFSYMRKREGRPVMPLHDPLAVAAVIDPSLLAWRELYLAVETEGRLTRGMSVADRRELLEELKERPNASVCLDVDVPRFLNLFTERVLWPPS